MDSKHLASMLALGAAGAVQLMKPSNGDPSRRFVRSPKSRKSAPGARRKGIKYMKPIEANTARRAHKPISAGMPHEAYAIGRAPAPSQDRVRELERKHGIRLHVIGGKLYHKGTTILFNL